MMNTYVSEESRWQAIEQRDKNADGQFWMGVRSTGVFCRPGCPARTPLRKNVVFFDSLRDALISGLRPCKRCRPLGASINAEQAESVASACRMIMGAESTPTLEEMASSQNMSPAHFQKLFSAILGVSPAQFARALRVERLQNELQSGSNVTRAIGDAGYNSHAQMYSDAPGALGMTPSTFRNRGVGESIRFATAETWLGPMIIAATERGICRLRFGEDANVLRQDLLADFANAQTLDTDAEFEHLVRDTVAALDTGNISRLPLDIRGTAFQVRVWHALRQIPLGTTVSYSELAERIGQPTAARAVASACANNEIAVLIPCHRVIARDGSLGGYRWGVDRKRALLERESQSPI